MSTTDRPPRDRNPAGVARRAAAWVCLGAGLLLLGVPPLGATGPAEHAGATCAPATLTASPSRGFAPLLTNFSVQISSQTPPMFSWSFGDGAYYNGSGPLYASPLHRFASPGVYNVSVVVDSSQGRSVCTTSVTVLRPTLTATAMASPPVGQAPLNVTFTATVQGGTGTYLSAVWWFDDGDEGSGLQVTYTFQTPGHYRILLNVTDSAGTRSTVSVWVNVSADSPGPGRPTAAPPFTILGEPGWVFALGGSALGVVVAALFMTSRNRSGPLRGSARGSPQGAPAGAAFDRPTPSDPTPLARVAPVAPEPASPRPFPGGVPDPVPLAREPDLPVETLRLSQRVVVHLSMQGALANDAVATDAFTQGGMADALGVPQNRLSNVLRRLRDAGAITEDVRHVSGKPRRMKVYRLTPLGERLGQDLRRRARAAALRPTRSMRSP
ncbi:MAG: PKD domain-containing protein [Thermoplasmata archaeon]|nr:PKD domain-containing protein [Thermoplasmata archaeon]